MTWWDWCWPQASQGWARRKDLPRVLILLYHRVNDVPTDPQLLCISPRHFEEHLQVLRRDYRPLRLRQAVETLHERCVPSRVVVTFDDGYADNLERAKPVLERLNIPATVFVATGYVGQDREFWWDELERLVLQPGMLPKKLRLCVAGKTRRWDLGEAASYSEEAARQHQAWHVLTEHDPSPRQRLYRTLYQWLYTLSGAERDQVLGAIRRWGGVASGCRPSHRPLSAEGIMQLVDGGLIEVGAHTALHVVLSGQSRENQRSEILQSKTDLEELVGKPVTSFAYPYGGRSDYTRETIDVVREAGFTCACSTIGGCASPRSDLFQLPRVLVRDWDGDRFADVLTRWFRD